MIQKARAFAPANISCLFAIHEHKNPRLKGSYGLGFTVNEGVTVEVIPSHKTRVWFNNQVILIPCIERVITYLTRENIDVKIFSLLPLGCGFGLSGASALATSYAVNKLLSLKKSKKNLAIVAHTAEVESTSGLGDVVNQYYGGVLLKLKPSSFFIVKKIPLEGIPVYCDYFTKISKAAILNDFIVKRKINKIGLSILQQLKEDLKNTNRISFDDIVILSKKFALKSGLLSDRKTLQTIRNIEENNGHASMIMLGNAVFSTVPFKGAIKLFISNTPTHVL